MAELNIIGAKEENRYFPYQSAFRVNRNSFWAAGQDSFTSPPSQNPDKFQVLNNVEPVLQGGLQRRRGYSLFSSQSPASPYIESFPFRSETLNLRSLVFTSSGNILVLNENGSVFIPELFTPSLTATFVPKMLVSRSYGYFSDGAPLDSLKWNGTNTTGNVTNWGIDITDVASSTAGPNGPGTATDLGGAPGAGTVGPAAPTTGVSSGGGIAWTNPSNITILDGSVASYTSNYRNNPSQTLEATGFSTNYAAAVPSGATINGVVVTIYRYATAAGSTPVEDRNVQLIVGGTPTGNNLATSAVAWPTATTAASYGSPTNLWGIALTPAEVNATDFGVALSVVTPGAISVTANVDYISITVYYTQAVPPPSWTNPNNILANDGNVATATATSDVSSVLEASNFGFSVSAPASGIQVDIKLATSTGSPNINVQLYKAGVATGIVKTVTIPNTTLSFITFGSSTDSWGGQFASADINDSGFGVGFSVQNPTGSAIVSVDYVRITVFAGLNAITVGAPASGNITLLNGRVYTFAFQNGTTGHTSTFGPFSLSTGPLTSNSIPLSDIPVSLDPQVDTKVILATADGGDETTLYLLATIPNSQTTYTDDTPDALTAAVTSGPSLLTSSIYQQSDSSGNLYGIFANYRPPLLNFPTLNLGRIYGAVGQTLYYSKSLSDVTTSTGTITGKWEEAWPAVNSLDISQAAETVTGLLSDGQTLYIATDTCIRRLIGDGPLDFQEPQVVFNQTGVVNQEVWKVVFAEGQPVGSIWLTPDNRVMFSDFNSYQDIGSPIQDVLNRINQAVVQTTAHACFVSKQEAEYYMLYLSIDVSTLPDIVCVYNMRTKLWFIWLPTDFITTSTFNYDILGNPQWLFATGLIDIQDRAAGSVYFWDSTVYQDQTGTTTPTPYAVQMQTSWLDFGDFGLTKAFNKILLSTTDPFLTVGVNGAIRQSDFASGGVTVIVPTVIQPEIFGEYFVPSMVGAPGYFQWYQVTFTSLATSTATIVLGSFDFEIAPSMRM